MNISIIYSLVELLKRVTFFCKNE